MLGEIIGLFLTLPRLQLIIVSILPVLFAITVHEAAHGWIAKYLGDSTAKRMGRVTLNPFKHIDPIGTVLVPMALLLFKAPFLIGWAKPVPVTWQNLRRPKRDMVLVAAAGPVANLLMAFLWALVAKMGGGFVDAGSGIGVFMYYMGLMGILINVLLMVFNLLPLPPLDGGRVAVGLLPRPWAWWLARVEPFGFPILLVLLLTGVLATIIVPPLAAIVGLVGSLVGLP